RHQEQEADIAEGGSDHAPVVQHGERASPWALAAPAHFPCKSSALDGRKRQRNAVPRRELGLSLSLRGELLALPRPACGERRRTNLLRRQRLLAQRQAQAIPHLQQGLGELI